MVQKARIALMMLTWKAMIVGLSIDKIVIIV